MGEFLLVGAASLLLGMRHATDPDHILAISTIVSRERSMRRASRIGAIWGLGHSFTVTVFGGAIIAFRVVLSPRVGLSLEFAVALMLILLGTLTLVRRNTATARLAPLRPFFVGVVHGLAGSAAAALLIVSTIDTVGSALAYLVIFGAGTLLGMAIMTSALAVPSIYASRHCMLTQRWVRVASGALTLGFGCYLAYRIGVVEGLLL